MKRIFKIFIICFGALSVLIIGFYTFNVMLFPGTFDKKYSREELENNFIKHENDFQELVAYFQSIVPSSYLENYQISFGLGKNKKHISIILYPLAVNDSTKSIGGIDLQKASLEFNKLLKTLNWNKEMVNHLEKKLSAVKCDVIRTVDYYGGCKMVIYPQQNGFSSYSYHIFETPLSDSLLLLHGKTISSSAFGKRVVLVYTNGFW